MSRIEKNIAFSIIFLGGWNFALPLAPDGVVLPVWAQPIQVVYGVFLKEALMMLYVGLFVFSGSLWRIRLCRSEARFALLIVGLGSLGILSTVVNLRSILDLGQAGRLFYYAVFFVIVLHWARVVGPAFILRVLLIGIASSGMLNLYYAFRVQWAALGGLPFLLGQNGPGGALGLAVCLGAWLMLIRTTRWDAIVAVTVSLVGVLGASISYSKTAMVLAAIGLVAWTAVVLAAATGRQTRRAAVALLALLSLIAGGLAFTKPGNEFAEGFSEFVRYKFYSLDYRKNNSVESRGLYFFSVAEIVEKNPLFGVGYSGFYTAVTDTLVYQSNPGVNDEGMSDRRTANPHNAFLLYASANGLPGLMVIVTLYWFFVFALRRSLSPYKGAGRVVWFCLAAAYFFHGNTLPTLFNTEVMYLPAAVAFARQVWHGKRVKSRVKVPIVELYSGQAALN